MGIYKYNKAYNCHLLYVCKKVISKKKKKKEVIIVKEEAVSFNYEYKTYIHWCTLMTVCLHPISQVHVFFFCFERKGGNKVPSLRNISRKPELGRELSVKTPKGSRRAIVHSRSPSTDPLFFFLFFSIELYRAWAQIPFISSLSSLSWVSWYDRVI
jgi:hypothetical protein